MQEEMRQQKANMLDMKEDIKNTIINSINLKFNDLELKNEHLEQQLEIQKNKIDNMERFMRKRNVLFFGVEERERSYQELEKKVLDIINNIQNIKCNENNIESVRRLGRKGTKIRPIVVTLTTMGLKIKILKAKKTLESSTYYLKEDFPPEIQNKRKELQSELEKERASGNRAIIKYDRIVILEAKNKQTAHVTSNARIGQEDSKKRNLSESPEATTSISTSQRKQPTKINKNISISNYLIKKPTLTYHSTLSPETPAQDPNKTTM